MTDVDRAEIRSRVRDAIESYLDDAEVNTSEAPTRIIQTIQRLEGGNIRVEDHPAQWPSESIDKRQWDNPEIDDTVDWLLETDTIHTIGDEEVQEGRILHDTRELAYDVVDYTGEEEFTETGFNLAFEDWWDRVIERRRYQIIPVQGLQGDFEKIELPFDFDWVPYKKRKAVDKLEIFRFEDRHLSALLNMSGPSVPDRMYLANLEYGVLVTYSGGRGNIDIGNKIQTLLRLFKPEERGVVLPASFSGTERRLNHHFGIPDLHEAGGMMDRSLHRFELNNEELGELAEFWRGYGEAIWRDGTNFDEAIRRYNQMWEKDRTEDALIDGMIALESTLVKDVNGGYSFRIPARGAILLSEEDTYSTEFVYEFLRSFYNKRNGIVHEDQQTQTTVVNGRELSPREYLQAARSIISLIIQEYIDYEEKYVITELNREVLEKQIHRLLKQVDSFEDNFATQDED